MWNWAKNVLTAEEIYMVFLCHRPLGKHCLARDSRGAKCSDFRGIMGQGNEKKQHGSSKIYTVV
jgi:hypothetical protein